MNYRTWITWYGFFLQTDWKCPYWLISTFTPLSANFAHLSGFTLRGLGVIPGRLSASCWCNAEFKDTQSLHQSIQQLYTLHTLDTFGVDALSIVNRLVPGNVPTFYTCHFRTRQVVPTFLPDFSGFTPAMKRTIDLYFGEHPIAARMPLTLNGAYKISDFITQQEFHNLEGVYQQFFRQLESEDLLNIFLPCSHPDNWRKLARTNASLMGICVDRSNLSFTERDRSSIYYVRT